MKSACPIPWVSNPASHTEIQTLPLIDPPYTAGGKKAGARLYTHHALDHENLFKTMASIKGSVMMTYDDAPEVRVLATKYGFAISQVPMKSAHHELHKELVLTRP